MITIQYIEINVITTKVQYPNPLNIGASRENDSFGPKPEYCPITNSRRNIGNPITNTIKKYTIKNAPEI